MSNEPVAPAVALPSAVQGGSAPAPALGSDSYWLTRFVLLRLLGLVYLVAFLIAANQIVPLIGHEGLLPADLVMPPDGVWRNFLSNPSVFWFGVSDDCLLAVAWIGVALSAVVLAGYANAILMTVLWALYMSFVHIGQDWYGYGWEIQLLETGFLAIFLCPLIDGRPFSRRTPPVAVMWLFRWLIFRIMIGAGLIKMRGDPCWRDLTCLYYHYETQPVPNPLSWYLHFMPHWFNKLGALFNHFVELFVPWFAFGPRRIRHVAGVLLVAFQCMLILSGNLSFLNWLTMVPALACFDDTFWGRFLPSGLVTAAARAEANATVPRAQRYTSGALVALIVFLSIAPVVNMISSRQIMNTSFDRLDLVNTYGAFGSVGRERREIIFEGTSDAVITSRTRWMEYGFKAKPGDVARRPCIITPYHYRLDWQMWFAAMGTVEEYPWTLNFVWKLLHNDAGTLSLLADNPFPDRPPRYVRAVLYRYEFAPPHNPADRWWRRTPLGLWLPPLSVDNVGLRNALREFGWLH